MDDKTTMPWGAHKGKPLGEVPAEYLLWIADRPGAEGKWPDLIEYINRNREALEMEVV